MEEHRIRFNTGEFPRFFFRIQGSNQQLLKLFQNLQFKLTLIEKDVQVKMILRRQKIIYSRLFEHILFH